jgi:aminobenzoyl-glutamate transport protein
LTEKNTTGKGRSFLDWIEWLGNKLPEPALLFAVLAGLVVLVAALGDALQWTVQPFQLRVVQVAQLGPDGAPLLAPDGAPMMTAQLDAAGKPVTELVPTGAVLAPRSILSVEGIYWALSSMIRNFTSLPAVGLVFVGMLGIGLAERFGLFSAFMRWLAMLTPRAILTPVIVFIGANSSVASDAGYIILPPLAAALYLAVGRHPVAGLAAVFAGVAGGFGGGFFPTAADGFLAGVATQAAHIVDSGYADVLATHNLYFKAGSAIIVTLAGWFVTDYLVEPRLRRTSPVESSDTSAATELALKPEEKKGLLAAGAVLAVVLGSFAAMILVPNMPLHGWGVPTLPNGHVPTTTPVRIIEGADHSAVPAEQVLFRKADEPLKDEHAGLVMGADGKPQIAEPGYTVAAASKSSMTERPGDRWSQVIVPIIFFSFLLPGMAFGWFNGTFRSQKDFVEGIYHGIKTIVPVLAIAFFMGQFVAYFSYTGLDRMLAFAGGRLLVGADLPIPVLLVLFVGLVIMGDFAISGMLSKFGVLAPIFIPMFMFVGISPELTTAAYRIGDSVVNIITPLNSYLLIILVVLQKYKRDAGLGSLISLMLPYSMVFFVAWTAFLLLWYYVGLPLGPGSGLSYTPGN